MADALIDVKLGAAPATEEPTPLTERERTDVMRAHDRARTLLGAYDGADPEVKPTLDQVFVAIDDLARAAGSSSPSGASAEPYRDFMADLHHMLNERFPRFAKHLPFDQRDAIVRLVLSKASPSGASGTEEDPPAEHPCALCGGDGPTHLTPSDRYLCTECWDESSASSLTLAEKLELDLDARNLRHD